MREDFFYLIDATAFCYRAFYGLKGLATSFGQPTNAIYGFLNMLNKVIKESDPRYVAVCFDVSRETFRQKKFAEYKIQRPSMPDELKSQIPYIKELVAAYGFALIEKEGYEADDIIATLSEAARKESLKVVIISSDKDILQLVDESTLIYNPYKDEGVAYDKEKVTELFGVEPSRVVDVIALMGDAADNIPSVPGIGEKTGIELIKQFGSLDNLLKNVEEVKKEKIRSSIKEHLDQIKLSRELAQLEKNVPIDFNLELFRRSKANARELRRLFKYLEFKKFLKDLPQEGVLHDQPQVLVVSDSDVPGMAAGGDELIFYGWPVEEMIFSARNKVFKVSGPGKNLARVFADPQIKKIGHDLKKERVLLASLGIELQGFYFDTMIAAYLLNPSKLYTPVDIAWDYLENANVSEPLSNLQAVALIKALQPQLALLLKEKGMSELFSGLEMPLSEVLARMEICGIALDVEFLRLLSREMEKGLIELIDKIYASSGTQFNINSTKQLRTILFENLKLPVIKKGKTGPSTDEEVLRALADKHKLPALLLEYRQLMKLKSTYVDALPELADAKAHRVHTTFNQSGTETGRLSSSNPNLQNIPIKTEIGRNIRRAFVAQGKGDCLLSCDYSQIELRILAHLSGDDTLIDAFHKQGDIHRATAALLFNAEVKDVTGEMREAAKRVNFGIVYGQSAYGLSRDLKVPLVQAQEFIDAYFLRYPGVKVYIDEQIKKAREDGFVTTLLGRRRYLPEIKSKNQTLRQFAERQAVNTPIQGTASDLIKLAMIKIDEDLGKKEFRSAMVLQIHDELLFEICKQEQEQVIHLVREHMEHVLELKVPIKVDIKTGINWLDMQEVHAG